MRKGQAAELIPLINTFLSHPMHKHMSNSMGMICLLLKMEWEQLQHPHHHQQGAGEQQQQQQDRGISSSSDSSSSRGGGGGPADACRTSKDQHQRAGGSSSATNSSSSSSSSLISELRVRRPVLAAVLQTVDLERAARLAGPKEECPYPGEQYFQVCMNSFGRHFQHQKLKPSRLCLYCLIMSLKVD